MDEVMDSYSSAGLSDDSSELSSMQLDQRPCTRRYSKPTIKVLQSSRIIADTAFKWYELGIALLDEDKNAQLKSIRRSSNDHTTCAIEMFTYWIESHTTSWDKLVEALKSVELVNVAETVERLFIGKPPGKNRHSAPANCHEQTKFVTGTNKLLNQGESCSLTVPENNDELVLTKPALPPINEYSVPIPAAEDYDQLKEPQETYDKGHDGVLWSQSQRLGQVNPKIDNNIPEPKNDETQPYDRENAPQHKMKAQTMTKDKGLEETLTQQLQQQEVIQKLQHFEKQVNQNLQNFEQQAIQKLQNLENKLNKVTELNKQYYAYSLCEMKTLQREHNTITKQKSDYIAHLKGEVDWLRSHIEKIEEKHQMDKIPHGITCVIV